MKKQVIESSVKVLYVETLVKMLEKSDTRQFKRCHKLLASLDDFMKLWRPENHNHSWK